MSSCDEKAAGGQAEAGQQPETPGAEGCSESAVPAQALPDGVTLLEETIAFLQREQEVNPGREIALAVTNAQQALHWRKQAKMTA